MNASSENLVAAIERRTESARRRVLLRSAASTFQGQMVLVAIGSAFLSLAVTRQSLWIDEALTAFCAAYPSARSLMHALIWDNGGSGQMPGYLIYMHFWVKLFGQNEIALRFANLPFAVLLLCSLSWVSTVLLKRPCAWLIVALSPFMWVYMNEARPYIALMAISSVMAAAILAYCMGGDKYARVAPWIAMASFTAALTFHMLAAFLGVTVLLFLVLSVKVRWKCFLSDWSRPALIFVPLVSAIVTYYVWTIMRGAGPAQRGEAGLKTISFVLYEFLGFDGLGPPRNDLRATRGSGLSLYLPTLALGCVALAFLLFVVTFARRQKVDRDFALSVSVGFMVAIVAYKVEHFRFVGRHLAVFYPFFVLALLMNSKIALLSRKWVVWAWVMLAVAWAVSDLRMVLLPIYAKDDYRGAAAVAIERSRTSGETILWAADEIAAYFYGLRAEEYFVRNTRTDPRLTSGNVDWDVADRAVPAKNWSFKEACAYLGKSRGTLILALGTKPDLFDQSGTWAGLVREPYIHAVLIDKRNSFDIYELSPTKKPFGQLCVSAKPEISP
jgi:uncharacterized membrane protein